ncbi:Phosphatidylinositol transfer protein 3 [Picochlorum sp. SENEW3]|nr:Phosphatidylinositol transfer protein 3 [Picochlorum sp. SENEW3]WPT15811.1 Phosphatidylinositol transfer protein 3 [Picochlorum sp. SENEW3]
MCASDTTERSIEPFARSITDKEKELVLQLEKEVSSIVEAHPPHKVFCTQGTYVRYLRARQFNVHKASKMLKETLKWREQYKPEAITWDIIQSEAALNKVTILDEFDNEGRPIVFMRPRNEKQSSDNELKLKYVVYIMEHASKIADESAPDGKMTWLLDYVGYNRQNQPPWKVSLSTLSIVQNHYPERLGRAVNFKPPWLFELFWKAIRPFVDPVTREKLVFLKDDSENSADMKKYFDLNILDACIGGTLPEGDMIPVDSFRTRMIAADEELLAMLATYEKNTGS